MKFSVWSDDFNRLIEATKPFVSGNEFEPRWFARYIRLDAEAPQRLTAIAVDGYRLSVEHCLCDELDESFTAYIRPTIRLPKKQRVTIELVENELIIRGKDYSFGFTQPKQTDAFDYQKAIPTKDKQQFRIGFNVNYLIDALQAAKKSVGGVMKDPVVIEFYGELSPAIIRTHGEDIKMVLPIRIKAE